MSEPKPHQLHLSRDNLRVGGIPTLSDLIDLLMKVEPGAVARFVDYSPEQLTAIASKAEALHDEALIFARVLGSAIHVLADSGALQDARDLGTLAALGGSLAQYAETMSYLSWSARYKSDCPERIS